MKKSIFILLTAALMLSSCAESVIEQIHPEMKGEGLLQIGLSVDENLQIVSTKASGLDESLVPSVEELYVELYKYEVGKSGKGWWKRLHFSTYSEMFESESSEEGYIETVSGDTSVEDTPVAVEKKFKPLRVNAGQWRLMAFHGDSTACGFDKPFFFADKTFTVDGGVDADGNPNITYVDAQAKVANARITVDFDETVSGSFYDYFVRFTNLDMVDEEGKPNKYKQILRYKKGQDKDAYMMPSENMQVEFMAQYEMNDENSWKFVNLGTVVVNPNDHLTINLSVNPRNGGLNVNITTDENIVVKESDHEIHEIWAPQNPPQIVAAGFPNNDHPVVEGDRTGNNATISVLARAGLKNFYIKLDSDYLTQAGFELPLGEEIDIANAGEAIVAQFRNAGISWDDDMLDSRRLTYLTMTELFTRINELNPSLTVSRNLFTITIRVVDAVGNETVKVLTSTAYPIVQTLSIKEGNVWAKKIISPELKVERGVSSLYELQVSEDGVNWTEDFRTFENADNMILDFGTIPAVSGKKYYFRTMYNNNPQLISNVVAVTTENELQVGNSGFEDYQTVKQTVKITWTTTKYEREWYLPYAENESDPWWAVNSKKTMPSEHTAAYWDFKNFPCTAYSTYSHSGDKSAMVYTINVNGANTNGTNFGDKVPGEIWIGTADDRGNHKTDGHAFASRPTALKFHYNYIPYNNETFVVTLLLKDASGNNIAKAEINDGRSTGEWSECILPIVYDDLQTKAAKIYISFKSCSSGGINMDSTMEIAGRNQTSHIGSVLRIDDVELIY